MSFQAVTPTGQDLGELGLINPEETLWNLKPAQLVEIAIRTGEGSLASNGALVVRTGQFTGRSPKDKYIVRDSATQADVNWGAVNQPMSPESFDGLYARLA